MPKNRANVTSTTARTTIFYSIKKQKRFLINILKLDLSFFSIEFVLNRLQRDEKLANCKRCFIYVNIIDRQRKINTSETCCDH